MDYKDVEVLIASGLQTLRSGLYSALKRIGVGRVIEVGTPEEAGFQIRNENFDVIILASEIGETFMGDLVGEIRHGRMGSNPCPIVIMLTNSTEADDIRKIAGCGADAALLTATAINQIGPRFAALALESRRFIVNHNYCGPDRRKKDRDGESSSPDLAVPNPLSAKIKRGGVQQLQRDIKQAAETLNAMKIDRLSLQLRWLVEGILSASKAEPMDGDKMKSQAASLVELCKDLETRTKNWLASPITELIGSLATAAKEIGGAAEKPDLLPLLRAGQKVAQEVKRVLGGDAQSGRPVTG